MDRGGFRPLTYAEAWRPLLAGIDAVVNCVGVLQDGARDDVRRVQVDGTVALFDACARAGIRRVVHVSAIGADRRGADRVRPHQGARPTRISPRLDLDWVILRPALVLAPAVYGGTAMLRGACRRCRGDAGARPTRRMQVVSIDDVTETVALLPARRARRRR